MVKRGYAALLAGALAMMPLAALAADHQDGPAAKADAASDITDVYAWTTTDHSKVNLIMNVSPLATTASKFSNAVQYVLHTTSNTAYGATTAASKVNIICTFDSAQKISCWAGNEYVTGDASATTGLTSTDGKFKVFAGLRDDPFFFNLDGFTTVATAVHGAVTGGVVTPGDFNAAGCPTLPGTTASDLATQLGKAHDGSTAVNFFAGLNVLSIVIQVDASLLTAGGPVVSVWGSTNHAS